LTWDQVDLDGRSWHLPDPKNRQAVTFPLSDIAATILEARDKDKPFVFPSWGKAGHIAEARGVLGKVSQAIGNDITAHDLRRTFRSVAGECHVELWRTKLLMNHKMSGDITINSYTETSDLRYLSDEVNTIAHWITTKALEAATNNVVEMKKRA
jgi:integrase